MAAPFSNRWFASRPKTISVVGQPSAQTVSLDGSNRRGFGLRTRLLLIAVGSMLAGLMVHFLVASWEFSRLSNQFWDQKLTRETEYLSSAMGWMLYDKYDDDTWLRNTVNSGIAVAFKYDNDKQTRHQTVGWTNQVLPPVPLDPSALERITDSKVESPIYCICGDYRVLTLRGWKNIVQYALPLSLTDQTLAGFRQTALTSSFAAVLVAGLLSVIAALTLTRPLAALSKRVGKLATHPNESLPGLQRGDEIGTLARALERGLRELQEARAREARFLAAASHELRTPVAALVVGLERDLAHPRSAREARAALERAHGVALNLRDLSGNLLLLSKNTPECRPALNVDLLEVASSVADELMPLAAEKGIPIEVRGSPALTCGDPSALRQIISNLIGNAIKYTEGGGITVCIGMRDGDAVIEIEDSGIGFPVEAKDREALLEPFARAAHETPGSGLGLTVVSDVIRRYGGSLRLENRLDGGARVTVILSGLPLALEAGLTGPPPTLTEAAESPLRTS
jgi:signal transduction histidine kinase